jgi:hypothetical protein
MERARDDHPARAHIGNNANHEQQFNQGDAISSMHASPIGLSRNGWSKLL